MRTFVVQETRVPLTGSHDGGQVLGLKRDGQGSVLVS